MCARELFALKASNTSSLRPHTLVAHLCAAFNFVAMCARALFALANPIAPQIFKGPCEKRGFVSSIEVCGLFSSVEVLVSSIEA